MKRTILAGLILISGLAISVMTKDAIAQVEYVRICSLYGAGWYYIPGSDICILPTTGEIRYVSPGGIIRGQSQMAYRVSQLEQRLNILIQKYKNQIKDDRSSKK